jgi:threonylcarbamoyladenosine tRNA methylthiotransferase MtaB
VTRQVERLAIAGFREIVICGVDLGSYGEDFESAVRRDFGLADLLREICAIDQDFRIRLSSIDPAHISDGLIEVLAGDAKLCPHLHLSLQSGSTLVLKRMKRRYDAALVYDKVARLRREIHGLVLSADLMVGFPTESAEQFQDSVRMVVELGIAYPHVFPYSERPGTPAARIPTHRQVPRAERKARAEALRAAGGGVRKALLTSRLGARSRVLVEGGRSPREGHLRARAPDYIEAWVPAAADLEGRWLDVVFEAVEGDALIARVAD